MAKVAAAATARPDQMEVPDGPTIISGEGLALTASWNGLAPLVFASVEIRHCSIDQIPTVTL